jgi:hypothetical protein
VTRLGERALELRYEDFLASPAQCIDDLAEFCGLDDTSKAVAAVAHVDADRAFAYRESPELRAFAEQNADRLGARGY